MKRIAWVLLASLAACSASSHGRRPVGSDGGCGRYEERVGNFCQPVDVDDVVQRELSFTRKGLRLHGTLTLPVTEGEYRPPVFVLVHGSGPNDRNHTAKGALGAYYGRNVETFRSLAEALAEEGAASYRYDKRTCAKENSEGRCPNSLADYPGDIDEVMVDDYIDDLREAIRTVAEVPELRGSEIVVVGLSQGANFVPVILAEEERVAAGVMLAGSSQPIDVAMVGQVREFADYLEEKRGPKDVIANLRSDADEWERALAQIRAGTYGEETFLGASARHFRNWMDRTDRLREEFLAVEKPILVMAGTLDFNVPPHHLKRFEQWAIEGQKTNAAFGLYPNVTHNFVTAQGAGVDYDFSDAVFDRLMRWHRKLP